MSSNKINKLVSDINKKFTPEGAEKSVIQTGDNLTEVEYIPACSYALGYAMGQGGWPVGKLIELFGPEGAGKTTLLLMGLRDIYEAYEGERVVALIDIEHRFNPDWATKLGLEVDENLIVAQPPTAEAATDIMIHLIKSGEVAAIGFDSIGGVAPEKEATTFEDQNTMYGGAAKVMSRNVRVVGSLANLYNVTCIYVNHVRADMSGYNRIVCLAGETKVITKQGLYRIDELAGKTHTILSRNGKWVDAPIDQYGEDTLWEITVERYGKRRKVLRANAEHRWPVRRIAGAVSRPEGAYANHELGRGTCPNDDCPLYGVCHCALYCGQETNVANATSAARGLQRGRHYMFAKGHKANTNGLGHGVGTRYELGRTEMVPTHELKPGDFLTTNHPITNVGEFDLVKWAVCQGFVFGDGTAMQSYGSLNIYESAPKDKDILPFFDAFNIKEKEDYTSVYGFPNYFKHLPDIDEPDSFLFSWLAGYFAADGDIDKDGIAGISSGNLKHIEFVRDVCIKLGLATNGIEEHSYSSKSYNADTEKKWYYISFPVGELPEHFFILSEHRNRWKPKSKNPARWKVVSVEPTDNVEPVYCAMVPVDGIDSYATAHELAEQAEQEREAGNLVEAMKLDARAKQVNDHELEQTFTIEDYILTGNTPGGHAVKHHMSQRLYIRRGKDRYTEKTGEGEVQVGFPMVFKNYKNSFGIPFREQWSDFYFIENKTTGGIGFDINKELQRLAIAMGIVERKGPWFFYDEVKAHGRENFFAELEAEGLLDDLKQDVMQRFATDATNSDEAEEKLADDPDLAKPATDTSLDDILNLS